MPQYLWWLASLLALSSLVGLSLLAALRLKLNALASFLPTTLIAMLALYLASLAGFLWQASITLSLGGLAALLLLSVRKELRTRIKDLENFRLFLVLVIGFGVLASVWLRDFRFVGYDEFTHWALMAKYLTDNHLLPTADSHIVFMQYAPGTAIIQYFFAWLAKGAEQSVVFGHLTLFFACLLFLTSQSTRLSSALAVIVWALLATYVLRYDLSFIFVDATLGALLGAALFGTLAYTLHHRDSARKVIWLLSPVVAYLPLVKHVGLVLGLSAVAVFAATVIQRRWSDQQTRGWNAFSGALSSSLIMSGALGLAYLSWKLHYQSLGIEDAYKQVVTLGNAIDFFVRPTDPTHLAVWGTFGKRMTSSVGIISAVLIIWSTILILLSRPSARSFLTVAFSTTALGFVGYLALLLLSYAFFFEGDERIHLASFERYARSYQLGWMLLLIAAPTLKSLWKDRSSTRPWAYIALAAGCIGLLSHPLARSSLLERAHISSTEYSKRAAIAKIANTINREVPAPAKIFFFDVLGDGSAWYMLRYELGGTREVDTCWSAAARLPDGSLGEINAGCEKDLRKVLGKYDYLVLFSSSTEFADLNRNLGTGITLEPPQLYKVDKTEGDVFSISPIEIK